MKTAEEIIIEKVGEYWWICGKHRAEFIAAMEEYAEQAIIKKEIEQSKEFIRDKFLELKKIPPNILQENYEKTKHTINKYWCNCENKTYDNKLKCPLHDRDNV